MQLTPPFGNRDLKNAIKFFNQITLIFFVLATDDTAVNADILRISGCSWLTKNISRMHVAWKKLSRKTLGETATAFRQQFHIWCRSFPAPPRKPECRTIMFWLRRKCGYTSGIYSMGLFSKLRRNFESRWPIPVANSAHRWRFLLTHAPLPSDADDAHPATGVAPQRARR